MSADISFPLFLFIISIASSFGVPLGLTFFIISAGSISGEATAYVFFVFLIFFGVVIGDVSAYTIASYFETGFIKKLRKYDRYRETYELSESFFNKYGASSVFLSRFLFLPLGAPVNYLSGFSKYSFRKFLISDASGDFLYAVIYPYLGFAFRGSSLSILGVIIDFSLTAVLILAGALALILLKKHLKDEGNNQ